MTVIQGEQKGDGIHPWLQVIPVSFIPGTRTPVIDAVMENMKAAFSRMGHPIQEIPSDETEVIFTSVKYGEVLGWRDALIFNIRRMYNLSRTPTFYTIVQISPGELREILAHFTAAIQKDAPDPADFDFKGINPNAYRVLYEQGRRGGPILALERLIQAQAKSIRVLLLVADEEPVEMYHFDLVGAYPSTPAGDPEAFYRDIVLRIATTMSTTDVNKHQVVGGMIPHDVWTQLTTPSAMQAAARQLGERQFFTDTVAIADVVSVPAVSDSVADQYSEGCFATWEPALNALIATVTGSARPVHKGSITDEDLAVIVGVRTDGLGALVQHVEGRPNDPPSSEAVELIDMDSRLPRIHLGQEWGIESTVPVVRSKLHGHRSVSAYDPCCVEYTPLDPPYFDYPVTCGTNAQAEGIKSAFARSVALQNPDDPRTLVFTILPGHGVVIAEKWVADKEPFQLFWEFMDAGYLKIDSIVPQGHVVYLPGPAGRYVLKPE